jgi:hypothetical protein
MSGQRYGNADPTGVFAVACPGCAAEIAVRASRMGSAARCPVCRGLFLVPEPRLPPAAPATTSAVALAAAGPDSPAAGEPLPALAPPPPPPGVAAGMPAATAFDDLELPAATGSSKLALEEPVRMVEADGRVIELRRVSDDVRRRRKARRSLVILLLGSAVLVWLVRMLGGNAP